ncbi:hypothetical protein VTK26DRAFT_2817 [Humicola hyalothermophila]
MDIRPRGNAVLWDRGNPLGSPVPPSALRAHTTLPTTRTENGEQDAALHTPTMLPCSCCMEEVEGSQGHFCVSRRHFWCMTCLQHYYNETIRKNEVFYTLQCCGAPVTLDLSFLPQDLLNMLSVKLEESATTEKTYCADPRCSAFIPTREPGPAKSATCPRCGKATCRVCKSTAHEGDCNTSQDPNEALLHQLAKENGWQRCSKCKRYVEMKMGCKEIL